MSPIDNNNTPTQKIEATEEEKPVVQATETTPEAESQSQINWKRFREQREIERKEKIEIEKRLKQKEEEAKALKEAMEAAFSKQSNNYNNNRNNYDQDDNDNEETEEQRLDRLVEAKLSMRERAIQEQREREEQINLPHKLATTYNDFNQICSQENIDYFEYHYPEVALAFENQPNNFSKWQGVYKAIKKLIPNTNSSKDAKKAEQNFNKPQSMTVPGATQTTDTAPQMLDEKRKADNYARMMRVMKGGR